MKWHLNNLDSQNEETSQNMTWQQAIEGEIIALEHIQA